MNLYKRLLQLVKPYWVRFTEAVICMIFVAALAAAYPLMVKYIFDDLIIKKDILILKLIPLALLGIVLFKGIFYYGQSYLMAYVGQRVIMDIRNRLYEHIQALSLNFFSNQATGTIMSRVTNDVALVERAASKLIADLVRESLTVVVLISYVFYVSPKLASIAILVLPLFIYLITQFGRKLRKVSYESQTTMGNINTILQETISGIRIVKAFCMEKFEIDKFFKENRDLFNHFMRSVRVTALSSPLMEIIAVVGIALVIWYGGYEVGRGATTWGTFFSFLTAVILLYEPIKKLSGLNNQIQQALAGAERVFEIIDTKPDIVEAKDAITLPPINKEIEFQNVSFQYEDNIVLQDINIKVRVGEIIAFAGSSGVGKTTLVNLIPRFYDTTHGSIKIDGTDIKKVTLHSLRKQIGMVTQDVILFNDTIKNNISYGRKDATEEDIIEAAKAAYAHEFIMEMPMKYDAVIGERGIKLSGGQRQRIAIARAILKNSPILILDEATSALDAESELIVQEALANLMKDRTTFVIAHRLSTIRQADKIIVLENGQIAEIGKHNELLKKKGVYQKLHEMQFRDNNHR